MPSPAAPLLWNDSLLLGDPEMDAVHEEFVACIAAVANAPEPELPTAFADLERHAKSHFDLEDTWMRDNDFPARECHINEHAAVMASIVGVRQRVEAGETAAARDIAQALADWFPGHADYLDSALAHWMCKRRWGGKPIVLRRGVASGSASAGDDSAAAVGSASR
jgi:hemerythrin-like metal-binding protein